MKKIIASFLVLTFIVSAATLAHADEDVVPPVVEETPAPAPVKVYKRKASSRRSCINAVLSDGLVYRLCPIAGYVPPVQ